MRPDQYVYLENLISELSNLTNLTHKTYTSFGANLSSRVRGVFLDLSKTFDHVWHSAQKMKFSVKDFFSKCDQTHRFLRIWSHSLKKSLMEDFVFCAVEL